MSGTASDDTDRLWRRVLWALPSGLYVVGSRAGDERNLMTANWVQQVAITPRLVAVALESGSVTRRLVESSGAFSVSLLARSDRSLVRRFVRPAGDVETDARGAAVRMQGEPVVEPEGAPPRPAAALAWVVCAVRAVDDWRGVTGGGAPASHVLVVGEVVDAGAGDRFGGSSEDDAVLTMADTRMHYGG